MIKKSTLTKKQKYGYALGIFTESLIYNMFYTYYLAFLIEIAGIKPVFSSVIIFISILWDAITDPIIGNYLDEPGVDKRRMMKNSIIPLALIFVLGWTAIGSGVSAQFLKVLVYTVISMLIWLFYTLYSIPFYAIVPELTEDYDERTEIRSISSAINAVSVGLGNILPALVPTVAILLGKRFESNSYAVIAAVISLIAIICGFTCIHSLKNVYAPKGEKSKRTKIDIKKTFSSFADILKLKPARFLFLFVFGYLCASSMLQSNITYLVIDCIGFEYDTGIVIFILTLVISMGITVPFVEKLAKKKDRRFAMISVLSVIIAAFYITKIIGLDLTVGGFKVMIFVYPIFLGVAQGTFWTLFYPMCYDLVEIDELQNGVRRESTITALPQFIQKLGSAVGILLAGQFLSLYGYTSEDLAGKENLIEQIHDEHIIGGMENISSLFPALILSVSIIFLFLYPVTRKYFNDITDKLKKKRGK